MPPDTDGWAEYKRKVVSDLERHGDALDQLQRDVTAIRSEISALKVRAGMWGLLAGAIASGAAQLLIK